MAIRISRYVPRKIFGALFYLIALGLLYYFYVDNKPSAQVNIESGNNLKFEGEYLYLLCIKINEFAFSK